MKTFAALSKPGSVLTENDLAEVVIEIGFQIHRKWGPGMLESVYEALMVYHLKELGLFVEQQKEIPFEEEGVRLPVGFRADIIVQHKLMVEVKSIKQLSPACYKTLGTYLRLSDIKLGLLMNFGEALLKDGLKRVINGQL